MENYFNKELSNNTVEAVKRGSAFFMNPNSQIPPIHNSFAGVPITGANYFNFRLSNDLNGTNHTEYVKVNEVLSSNMDWLSALRESRAKGVVYQEESPSASPRYTFMMPADEFKRDVSMQHTASDYVPFQSSHAPMNDFENFIREQCANALNASLTGCTFRNNIPEQQMDQYKAQLIDEITRNPAFMAEAANRAQQEVNEFHRLPFPFDRNNFIEKARNENSDEFRQLNSAITEHVTDMYQNRKISFNPEFDELSRPLVIKIENIYVGSSAHEHKPAIDREITDFVKENINQDKPAKVLTDTFLGTFVEKTRKLIQENPRVSAGLALACSIVNPIIAKKIEVDDFIKIADNIVTLQKLKGDKTVKASSDSNDAKAFNASIEKAIRDNPQLVVNALAQLNDNNHQHSNNHQHGHSPSVARR